MDNYQNGSSYQQCNYTHNPFDASANFVSYPLLSSYPQMNNVSHYEHQQQHQQQQQQNHDNSYNPALNDYASQQYQQLQINKQMIYKKKMQSHLKTNAFRKASSPYSKPPANNQQFYCELCKVSCAGEQSYKDHCDGQKHKKKEVGSNKTSNGKNSYFCELCQVSCSCLESYNAHLSGKNHIKVCNLQAKMGKEVPPELIAPIMKLENNNLPTEPVKTNNTFRVIGTPAINFVKGESLRTMAGEVVEIKCSDADAFKDQATNNTIDLVDGNSMNNSQIEASVQNQSHISIDSTQSQKEEQIPSLNEQSMQTDNNSTLTSNNDPVGLEFVAEYKIAGSKATYYSCDLCNCKFSEKNAKEQHVRGKRHHRAYNLHKKNGGRQSIPAICMSPTNYSDRRATPPPLENLSTLPLTESPKIASLLNNNHKSSTPRPTARPAISTASNQIQYPNHFEASYTELEASFVNDIDIKFEVTDHLSNDDKYMYKKHSEIIPKEDQIKTFYRRTYQVEKCLKQISDEFHQNKEVVNDLLKIKHEGPERMLAGELRAGLFGKKLLLNGEKQIDLILVCSAKPNVPLLKKMVELLSTKLELIDDFKCFKLEENIPESAIDIRFEDDCLIRITLTSLLFRSAEDDNGSGNLPTNANEELNKTKCLDALTSLRRIKWYQVKVHPFNPCPMILRILRDLCKRVDAWKPLSNWCLELICERVLSSCMNRPTPSEALRCILQALSAGIILIDPKFKENVILADPCEFGCRDAIDYLDEKQRIDLTESAKNLLQLILFNKIYQVLDTNPIVDAAKSNGIKTVDDKENDVVN